MPFLKSLEVAPLFLYVPDPKWMVERKEELRGRQEEENIGSEILKE